MTEKEKEKEKAYEAWYKVQTELSGECDGYHMADADITGFMAYVLNCTDYTFLRVQEVYCDSGYTSYHLEYPLNEDGLVDYNAEPQLRYDKTPLCVFRLNNGPNKSKSVALNFHRGYIYLYSPQKMLAKLEQEKKQKQIEFNLRFQIRKETSKDIDSDFVFKDHPSKYGN
jgi:hypothetical protein